VRLPITVTPCAAQGDIRTLWCGPPVIIPNCSGNSGDGNSSCHFTLEQTFRIALPIEIGATAELGDPYVRCGIPVANTVSGCNTNTLGDAPEETLEEPPDESLDEFLDEPVEESKPDEITCPLKNMLI
jgi:hypothetical protein